MDPSSGESNGISTKIINASLFRMGTKSMAQAYIMLGYKTHHALLEGVFDTPWNLLEQAAEATWPSVPGGPTSPRRPNSRADWDAIWGSYNAVTDLASPFAIELIKNYPEAKVVIVQRDFDSWWPSFRSQIRDTVMKQPLSGIQAFITYRILGVRPVHATTKIILGFFNARSRLEVDEKRAREVYDEYFRQIRELVPPERRLEYKMGSGWQPLCTFLGVEEPSLPFPRANERAANSQETNSRHLTIFSNGIKVVGPWILGAVVAGAAWFYFDAKAGTF
ncbi:hypothetical protein F4821DRAFT_247760 [Hypoxylon rubiginosum]|uniref:Uncharacterized protein n=1 Tax=Hypoxylon rubiginosum TaxID=110542 RepID=A0ACC0CNZ2_9PEZI|nr:hypothetical protein F4821DRAFT_247760 [Hypoxylon rubiginosum]